MRLPPQHDYELWALLDLDDRMIAETKGVPLLFHNRNNARLVAKMLRSYPGRRLTPVSVHVQITPSGFRGRP